MFPGNIANAPCTHFCVDERDDVVQFVQQRDRAHAKNF